MTVPLHPSTPAPLLELLERLSRGEVSVTAAAQQVQSLGTQLAVIDGATVDLGRQTRCGFGEVIFGEGKSAELIVDIARQQLAVGQRVLVTRVEPSIAQAICEQLGDCRWNALARTLIVDPQGALGDDATGPPTDDFNSEVPHVAVVTAGSTDRPIAEEAIETLLWMGVRYERFCDIGVAGPQRLLAALPRLRRAAVVVVIAGMEGALPPVVAGHLAVPVIAVPTSVGYGANLGGVTAMLGMLSCCAANVAVVNIDAGFKGGYLAGLIVSQLANCKRVVHE